MFFLHIYVYIQCQILSMSSPHNDQAPGSDPAEQAPGSHPTTEQASRSSHPAEQALGSGPTEQVERSKETEESSGSSDDSGLPVSDDMPPREVREAEREARRDPDYDPTADEVKLLHEILMISFIALYVHIHEYELYWVGSFVLNTGYLGGRRCATQRSTRNNRDNHLEIKEKETQ